MSFPEPTEFPPGMLPGAKVGNVFAVLPLRVVGGSWFYSYRWLSEDRTHFKRLKFLARG